ncbi:MAG: SDR family NAD(P)-dependent oxidoreductase, partial [Nitrososphaerales archaeon]
MQADRILVTGGAGFIGSHVVDTLVEKGYEVTVYDNLSTGKVENIRSHINDKTIKFVNGDITDSNAVKNTLQGCDAVIHLAAVVSVPQSIKDPLLVNKVNVTGTLNVLNSSVRAKITKFVFASSAAVYGDAKPPHHEDLQLRALSPYA